MARIKKIYKNWTEYQLWVDAYSKTETDSLLNNKADSTDIKDSKITVKRNGTKVKDFTLNQATDEEIDINVPEYEVKQEAQWWTAESLVTTWEKYTYNHKQDKLIAGSNITIGQDWKTISATDTTYDEVSKSDIDTGTSTTAGVVSAKTIADYVSSRVASGVNYKGQVADYASLPANPELWDMYNVVAAHTTAPKFDAWTNVVWNGTSWDPMAEMVDLSNLVDKTSAQSISGKKTFTTEPAIPNKTSAPTSDWTKPASEKQVYDVKQIADSKSTVDIITQTEYWNLPNPWTDWIIHAIYE